MRITSIYRKSRRALQYARYRRWDLVRQELTGIRRTLRIR